MAYDRIGHGPPRSDAEILSELGGTEDRHDGPCVRERHLDEIAVRRRWERDDPETLLRADLVRFENVRAEHLRWLRISVRHLRTLLRQPESARRDRQVMLARDAVAHNKDSVRIWTDKVADARVKLDRARREASRRYRWPAAAE